jgi:L-amino acid N-acyltransferase YncA
LTHLYEQATAKAAMPPPSIIVRPCFQQDLEQVQLIYRHHVVTGTSSFEIEPPELEEMTRRWSLTVEQGWPYLAASPTADLTRVLGFAYAGQFRARAAYSKTFEDSVYVAPSAMRRGVGLALMAELLTMLKADGAREVLALIGDSANQASIQLHAKAGFAHVGVMRNVGRKFDRWLDVVVMQRSFSATPA